jgi:hypothetical protein
MQFYISLSLTIQTVIRAAVARAGACVYNPGDRAGYLLTPAAFGGNPGPDAQAIVIKGHQTTRMCGVADSRATARPFQQSGEMRQAGDVRDPRLPEDSAARPTTTTMSRRIGNFVVDRLSEVAAPQLVAKINELQAQVDDLDAQLDQPSTSGWLPGGGSRDLRAPAA